MGKGKGLKDGIKYGIAVAKKNKPGMHVSSGKNTLVSYRPKGAGVRQRKTSTGGSLGKNGVTYDTKISVGRKPKTSESKLWSDSSGNPAHYSGQRVKKTKVPGVYKTNSHTSGFDSKGTITQIEHGTVIHPAYPAAVGGVVGVGAAGEGYRRSQSKHPGTRNKRNG